MSLGANVKAVQRMLGHASAAVTLDVYADLFDADTDALSAALDRVASRPIASMGRGKAGNEKRPASGFSRSRAVSWCAPSKIRTCAPASGGQCSIP